MRNRIQAVEMVLIFAVATPVVAASAWRFGDEPAAASQDVDQENLAASRPQGWVTAPPQTAPAAAQAPAAKAARHHGWDLRAHGRGSPQAEFGSPALPLGGAHASENAVPLQALRLMELQARLEAVDAQLGHAARLLETHLDIKSNALRQRVVALQTQSLRLRQGSDSFVDQEVLLKQELLDLEGATQRACARTEQWVSEG